MKIWLLILVLLIGVGSLYVYLFWGMPLESTVRSQFLERYPNSEIISQECIFDFEPKPVLLYLIQYREAGREETKLGEIRMKQKWNSTWEWCDDHSERPCK